MLKDRGVGIGFLHYPLELVNAFKHSTIIAIQYIGNEASIVAELLPRERGTGE